MERPILFSGEMVRTILDGRKTQTRRVIIKWPPKIYLPHSIKGDWPIGHKTKVMPGIYQPISNLFGALTIKADNGWLGIKPGEFEWICPYGKPGDLLWVRETWADIPQMAPGNLHYRANATEGDENWFKEMGWKWRPSIFMPHWASRLMLKITNVRVESLQEITYEDAVAEGTPGIGLIGANILMLVTGTNNLNDAEKKARLDSFAELWDSINVKNGYPWSSNPWVWVITFEVMGKS